jgi:hypothetical protein
MPIGLCDTQWQSQPWVRGTPLGKPKLEPDTGKCVCGRELQDAVACVYRSNNKWHVFHRCDCGVEWTEHRSAIDPTDPVSSDEVIEVHTRLAKFEGSITELLGQLSV